MEPLSPARKRPRVDDAASAVSCDCDKELAVTPDRREARDETPCAQSSLVLVRDTFCPVSPEKCPTIIHSEGARAVVSDSDGGIRVAKCDDSVGGCTSEAARTATLTNCAGEHEQREGVKHAACVVDKPAEMPSAIAVNSLDGDACGDGRAATRRRRVVYFGDDAYAALCDALPRVPGRVSVSSSRVCARVLCFFATDFSEPNPTSQASRVHSLIKAYGLLESVKALAPWSASLRELETFHSSAYVRLLSTIEKADTKKGRVRREMAEHGIDDECHPFPRMLECLSMIAGASLHCADVLMLGGTDVAINWNGGWHHASRDSASGFCYINDAALAILRLSRAGYRVLYVDIDLHHGDGVEGAFEGCESVTCLSFHRAGQHFFPGTGHKCHSRSVNVPVPKGIDDVAYGSAFARVFDAVVDAFKPTAIVLQCGADGLASDPHKELNLTTRGLGMCVAHVLKRRMPTALLGGGGYCHVSAARLWAYLTAIAAGVSLPDRIPEHVGIAAYGPDFLLHARAATVARSDDGSDFEKAVRAAVKYASKLG